MASIQAFKLADGFDAFPIVHGKAPFAMGVRRLMGESNYGTLALAFPKSLYETTLTLVEKLPYINGAAIWIDGKLSAYIPADPCDAYIEGIRQALSRRLSLQFLEGNDLLLSPQQFLLPDAMLLEGIGSEAFSQLAEKALENYLQDPVHKNTTTLRAHRIYATWKQRPNNIPTLLLCDFPIFFALRTLFQVGSIENTLAEAANSIPLQRDDDSEIVATHILPIRNSQLYFALGELPHYAGELEKERQNALAHVRSYFDLVKSLLIGTRFKLIQDVAKYSAITVKKVQTALTFIRNLTVLQGRLTPGLHELIAGARGVFGHQFAASLLEAARSYPFSNPVSDEGWMEVGKETIRLPGGIPTPAFNVLSDEPKIWKALYLRRDPEVKKQQRYRYAWDSRGMCSHVPEDIRIERFNNSARAKGREFLFQGFTSSEPLTSSLKDGIDMRATLRDFGISGRIHVQENPPLRGQIDTVVILFDTENDSKYPFRMAWTYEHADESMLTFYGTEPFEEMVGPGIARAQFGGMSLLFPPRSVPDIFRLPAEEFGFKNLAEQLLFGALKNTAHKAIALVSSRRPTQRMRNMASDFHKRISWVPIQSYSAETLRRLRYFHVLNGQKVRAWASRFIEE